MSRPRREKRRSIRRRRWGNCRCRRSSPTGRTSECTASRGLQYCPVRYSPKAARQAGSGARQKAGNFLPKPLVRGIVFQKSAAPRPGLLIGAGHSSFGRGAKRNGVEAIENNEFREMPHFASLRISRAYACVAKSFASLREMNASLLRVPRVGAAQNAVCDPHDGIARLRGSEGRTTVPNGAASG